MDVVGHKDPAVYLDVKLVCALGQPICVSGDICIAGKADLTIDATLNNMDREPGGAESSASWHFCLNLLDAETLATLTNCSSSIRLSYCRSFT